MIPNTVYNGEALQTLKGIFPDESVDLIVTSPPYYGLRDYGSDGQIGREKTPKEYIDNLMAIINQCHRVLKKSGSLWVNIGDSYGGTGSKGDYKDPKYAEGRNGQVVSVSSKLSPKSLLAIPERFVIAMTDAGWIRRNSVIWYKPNAMPSSAKDRFTVDFEYFYFFTKYSTYYFETQYQPLKSSTIERAKRGYKLKVKSGYSGLNYENRTKALEKINQGDSNGAIKRCIWNISLQPFPEAHFAVFPEKLVETPIKACCPPKGIVLDPFFGSGTVGVVAKRLGRDYCGIELNPEYIKIANKRLGKIERPLNVYTVE